MTRNYVVSGIVMDNFQATWERVAVNAARIQITPVWSMDALNLTVTGQRGVHVAMARLARATATNSRRRP